MAGLTLAHWTPPRRVLSICIAASIALHVAVLLAFPKIARRDTASVEVLQVTLLKVEPPRPLAMQPEREPTRPIVQKHERVVENKRPLVEKKPVPAPAPPPLLAL